MSKATVTKLIRTVYKHGDITLLTEENADKPITAFLSNGKTEVQLNQEDLHHLGELMYNHVPWHRPERIV